MEIEVTPFIGNDGLLRYEIALDDSGHTRFLEVTEDEANFLCNSLADLDHDVERQRLE